MIQIFQALFQIIFSLLEALFGGLVELIVTMIPSKRNDIYNADFMSPDKLLSSHDKGFRFGDKSLSIHNSFSNCLVLGGSGSGKSSTVLINSILSMAGPSSLVIHDPSQELYEKTSGAIASLGYTVLALNYANPNKSQKYNPLSRIKSISEIKKLAKILIQTSLGSGGKDPFWNSSAESLLSTFIRYVIFHTPKENHTLYNVLCLINAFSGTPKKVDLLFIQAQDDDLLSDYKSFVAYDTKMLMSIVATARTALNIFSDPSVIEATKTDSIDFAMYRSQKVILYINNSVNDMKYYSVISSIFFEQFFASVMSKLPSANDLPIFFLLDEASSLYLNILPTAISNIRKANCGIMQVYQSQSQLIDMYQTAQANNIISNCFTRVYLPGQPLEVARQLELILGKREYVDDENVRRTRQLLTMDEIRILKESIILCGNHPPIKMKLKPYYEQKELKRLSEMQPYEIQIQDEVDELEQDELTVLF
ncbi:MAG: type IV secretory system conjugative DNA transfer family protein [Bacteroidetes bacterium]|nr:type IV secretory system conjugative DNA transfer family protein [Bacteroidota bacterium]